MKVVRKSCATCGYHVVHTVWGKREDGSWYQYDGSRCHAEQALKNYQPDNSGGIKIGRFCWECAGRYWIPSSGNDSYMPSPRKGYFIYEDPTNHLNQACARQTEWDDRLIAVRNREGLK